jgi:hypothetical protein
MTPPVEMTKGRAALPATLVGLKLSDDLAQLME